MKKLLMTLTAVCISFGLWALDHGSMLGNEVPIYPQRDGAVKGTAVEGVSFDYKLVTIGSKTWVWTQWNGRNIAGNGWSSQYRYWPGKVENWLLGRVQGTQQTFDQTTALPAQNPTVITFLQEENNVFFETDDFTYDYTKQNSADEADNTAPVLAEPTEVSQTATELVLQLSATDDSGHFFYLVTDDANNFKEVYFTDKASIALDPVDYNFVITAIDFSGNVSNERLVSVEGEEFSCANNLMTSVVLTPGEVYFAPGWGESENFTFAINANDINITLQDATYEMWQAQFPVHVAPAVELTPGEKYSLVMDVETTEDFPFYAKFYDGDDNQFLEVVKQTIAAPGKSILVIDYVCPPGLTKVSKILFDFGGNVANTQISIKDMAICDNGVGASVGKVIGEKMRISSMDKSIYIHTEDPLQAVKLFSVTGTEAQVLMRNHVVDTANLMPGLYILSVSDQNGNRSDFKVIVK